MAKVVLGLQKKNPLEKKQFAEHMVEDMTGNVNYTSPNPPLADITSAAGDVGSAINAVTDAREALITATNNLDAKVEALDTKLTSLGDYIQTASGGNKEIIESSGAQTKKTGTASPAPVTVLNFLMDEDEIALWVNASWKGLPKSYNVQLYEIRIKIGSVESGNWSAVEGGSTSRVRLRFQVPAAGRVWAQVRARNAAGWGPWSDPATIVVAVPL